MALMIKVCTHALCMCVGCVVGTCGSESMRLFPGPPLRHGIAVGLLSVEVPMLHGWAELARKPL